jgi:hypothetical protein
MEAGSGSRIAKSARIHADPEIDQDSKQLSQLSLIYLHLCKEDVLLNGGRSRQGQKRLVFSRETPKLSVFGYVCVRASNVELRVQCVNAVNSKSIRTKDLLKKHRDDLSDSLFL